MQTFYFFTLAYLAIVAMASSLTTVSRVDAANASVFYRQAGPQHPDAPTVLLLHGFPTSSHQYRNVMPLLADKGYRVIAPDLPGYGFTTVPEDYVYTFDNLADTIDAFVAELGLKKFAIYIFDYGAPTGLRLALRHPEKIAGIVTQNGNAYEEGLGADFWAPIQRYWASGSSEDREALRPSLEIDTTRWQYTNGAAHPEAIQPETWTLDQDLMDRPGNKDIQLDLFYDYRTNLPLYPRFQEYFRDSDVPVLAMWGEHDDIFVRPGAEAYRRDVKRLEVQYINSGHFALETNEKEAVHTMDKFFKRFRVFE